MSKRKLMAAAAVAVSGVLALSACTPTPTAPGTATEGGEETTAQVAWNQAFFAYNSDTSVGNATANNNILYMTQDQFVYFDDQLELKANESLGTYERTSEDPLTINQTVASTARWSDGVPVTPADLILNWGAGSGNFNTVEADAIERDEETDEITQENTGDQVFFDSSSAAWALITEFPEVDGASVTYTYSRPYVDWEYNLFEPDIPAHIVGKRALGIDDPTEAADAVVAAFRDNNREQLAQISNVWNSDYNFTTMPTGDDAELVIGTGPYVISDLTDSYTTVSRNPEYQGEREVSIDNITVRIISDPQASVQALQNGEVLVTQPQATSDILTAMEALEGVSVRQADGGTYEHVDFAMNNGGPFDPATYGGNAETARLVRQAFMHTIPRDRIMSDIIQPLNPEASIRNTYTVIPGAPDYDAVAQANGMESTYGTAANLQRAQELLTQAGVTTPVNVRFMTDSSNTRRQQELQLITESAQQAGFAIENVSRTDWGRSLSDTSLYDVALFGWQSTSTAVGESDANYRTGGLNNYYGYSNLEVDALFDELQVTVDPTRQVEILSEVEQKLVEDGFGLTLFQHPQLTAVSDRLQNVSSSTIAPTYFWNFWEWELA